MHFKTKHQRLLAIITGKNIIENRAAAATAWDAYNMLIDAIERAGSTDPTAIKEALYKTDMEGVTGHIKIDENGDAIKPVTILGYKDGVKKIIAIIQPEEKK